MAHFSGAGQSSVRGSKGSVSHAPGPSSGTPARDQPRTAEPPGRSSFSNLGWVVLYVCIVCKNGSENYIVYLVVHGCVAQGLFFILPYSWEA